MELLGSRTGSKFRYAGFVNLAVSQAQMHSSLAKDLWSSRDQAQKHNLYKLDFVDWAVWQEHKHRSFGK